MSTPSSSSRLRRPLWLIEGLDIAEQRRLVVLAVTGLLAAVGVVVSLIAPGIVPPTPGVGAAVGFAALLLGYAAAVAVDAADLTVRGPRHVRAAGAELVALVPSEPSPRDAEPLARAVLDAREGDERILLGLAATGRGTSRVVAWTDELATALARQGVSVLTIDLASGRSEGPGLHEVLTEGQRIGSVADIHDELLLARVTAGGDLRGALDGLPELAPRLPRDLNVLLVALPTAASREVVAAATALDHLLVVAERGVTARVDLIAALDALERSETPAQAVLVDDRTVGRLAGPDGAAGGAGWSATSPPADAAASGPAPEEGEEAPDGADAGRDVPPPVERPAPPSGDEDAPSAVERQAAPEPQPGPATVPGPTGERGVRIVPAPAPPPEPPEAGEDPQAPAPEPAPEVAEDPVAPSPEPAPEAEHRDPVESRDADVLRAADAARAREVLEHRHDPPAPADARSPDAPGGPTPAGPGPERYRPTEPVPSLTPEPHGEPDEPGTAAPGGGDDDGADTDQLPRQRPGTATEPGPATEPRGGPPDPSGAPEAPEERAFDAGTTPVAPEEADVDDDEALHATAQLAILVDELEDRQRRS